MHDFVIDVAVDNRQDATLLPLTFEATVASIAELAASRNLDPGRYEVSVVITGDDDIRQLNREYRGIDSATDVLSFAMRDGDDDFELPEGADEPELLGDIVVSADAAARQALEYGHSLERELSFLVTHGLLHLMGFDHIDPSDEPAMLAEQKAILSALSIGRESQ
jgi:probable rRNA maturation factor